MLGNQPSSNACAIRHPHRDRDLNPFATPPIRQLLSRESEIETLGPLLRGRHKEAR